MLWDFWGAGCRLGVNDEETFDGEELMMMVSMVGWMMMVMRLMMVRSRGIPENLVIRSDKAAQLSKN